MVQNLALTLAAVVNDTIFVLKGLQVMNKDGY